MVKTNKTIKKETKEKKEPAVDKKSKKYFEAVGRRKTSTARVRLLQDEKTIIVNGKPLEKYFPTVETQQTILSVFQKRIRWQQQKTPRD